MGDPSAGFVNRLDTFTYVTWGYVVSINIHVLSLCKPSPTSFLIPPGHP
jgi:hypothetical protein